MLKPKYLRDILGKYLKPRLDRETKLEIVNEIVKKYEALTQKEKATFYQSYKQSQDKSSYILVYFGYEKLKNSNSSMPLKQIIDKNETEAEPDTKYQERSDVKMVVRMPEEYGEFMRICEKNSLDSKKILTEMLRHWIDKNKHISVQIDYS